MAHEAHLCSEVLVAKRYFVVVVVFGTGCTRVLARDY